MDRAMPCSITTHQPDIKRLLFPLSLLALLVTLIPAAGQSVQLSDTDIAAIIVSESSIRYYAHGVSCACPDASARNGSVCIRKWLYHPDSGAKPLCRLSDVEPWMIETYRRQNELR